MDQKDAAIRTSGLLQAIIASGAPPDQWVRLLKYAIKVHVFGMNALIDHKYGKEPQFKE